MCLRGQVLSPYVQVTFNDEAGTRITVGNRSQPTGGSIGVFDEATCRIVWHTVEDYCSAAIKSFQYGFGSQNRGSTCKLTIVDEKGGSFTLWANKLAKNIESANYNYKMIMQFGWLALGDVDTECVECACGEVGNPGFVPGGMQGTYVVMCWNVGNGVRQAFGAALGLQVVIPRV